MVSTNVKIQNKQQMLTLLNDFLEHFPIWCNQANNPSSADLEKFVSPNFEIISNGEVLCSGVENYVDRFATIRSRSAHVDLIGPLEEPVFFEGNKVWVQYEVKIRTRDGKNEEIYIMAIASWDNNKFSNWTQVTHFKNNPPHVLAK